MRPAGLLVRIGADDSHEVAAFKYLGEREQNSLVPVPHDPFSQTHVLFLVGAQPPADQFGKNQDIDAGFERLAGGIRAVKSINNPSIVE